MAERIRSIAGYAASRTKWFDEFFIAAGAGGIEQAVILAAGLDARAWRLPWNDGSVVYEIDQPKVLAFKAETLHAHGAQPAARYVAVPVDLRHDWPKALREAGFDASEPTAWAAEGLLPYLPADGQDLLFERIADLSAHGSRVAVEAFGAGFFDPEYLASRRERVRQLREAGGRAGRHSRRSGPLVHRGPHRVTDWFSAHGWEVSTIDAAELMKRFNRTTDDDTTPRTAFVEARLSRLLARQTETRRAR